MGLWSSPFLALVPTRVFKGADVDGTTHEEADKIFVYLPSVSSIRSIVRTTSQIALKAREPQSPIASAFSGGRRPLHKERRITRSACCSTSIVFARSSEREDSEDA
jgi:hypothetical protein